MGNTLDGFSVKVAAAGDITPHGSVGFKVRSIIIGTTVYTNMEVTGKRINVFSILEARSKRGNVHFGILVSNAFAVPDLGENYPYMLIHAMHPGEDESQLMLEFFIARSVEACKWRLTSMLGEGTELEASPFKAAHNNASATRLIEAANNIVVNGFHEASGDIPDHWNVKYNCVRATLSLADVLADVPVSTHFQQWMTLQRNRISKLMHLSLETMPRVDCTDVAFWTDIMTLDEIQMKLQEHKSYNSVLLQPLSHLARSAAPWSTHSYRYRVIVPNPTPLPGATHHELARGNDLAELQSFVQRFDPSLAGFVFAYDERIEELNAEISKLQHLRAQAYDAQNTANASSPTSIF